MFGIGYYSESVLLILAISLSLIFALSLFAFFTRQLNFSKYLSPILIVLSIGLAIPMINLLIHNPFPDDALFDGDGICWWYPGILTERLVEHWYIFLLFISATINFYISLRHWVLDNMRRNKIFLISFIIVSVVFIQDLYIDMISLTLGFILCSFGISLF